MVVVICGRGGRLGDGHCGDNPRRIGAMVQPFGRSSRASRCTNPRPRGLAVAGVRGRCGCLWPLWRRCCFPNFWWLGRALRSPALAFDRRRAHRRFVLDSPVDYSRYALVEWSAERSPAAACTLTFRRRCVARPARVVMVAGVARPDSGTDGLRRGQHARAGFGSGAGGRHRLGDGDPSRASCTRGSWPQPTAGGPLGPCPSCRTTLAHGGGDVHVRRDGVRCGRPWRLHQFLRGCFWGFC